MQETERGQFRSIKMDDLHTWAHDPRWNDDQSKNLYIFPVDIDSEHATKEGLRLSVGNPPDETYRRGPYVCASSPQSHIGPFKNAIDFLVPDGTPVIASYSGIVVEVQEHSDTWGTTAEFRDHLNYITIQHENGEFSQYCHLAQNSVGKCKVKVGSRVEQGQQIGTVGKTGWTDRDHLHFIVFQVGIQIGPFTFRSLVPRFA